MSSFAIHPETRIGHVALTVADIARSLSFYEEVLGFAVERRGAEVVLRAGSGEPLIQLAELPGAQPKPQHTTGLYHYAIRLPDRASLALVLQQLQQTGYGVQGASDHGVSEALYLADPDGNGIEIYRDRPSEEWPRQGDALEMGTASLDVADLLATPSTASSGWHGAPEGTDIGHVHLHVADLDAARRFYCDALGFTLMQRYGHSALFVSAGGYHHHIGLNTWAGAGAPPPPDDAVGLRYFALRLPGTGALDALVAHCAEVGIATTDTPEGIRVADPSGNTVLLTTAT
jgi:catechol 2,3-dioxygenase